MLFSISPSSVIPLIRFFFIDMVKFLLKSDLYREGADGSSAGPGCCKTCLRELLADHTAHLTDGLHTADQILHSHNSYLQKKFDNWEIRNKSSSETYGKIPGFFPVLPWSYWDSWRCLFRSLFIFIVCPLGGRSYS